jgi:acetylornithine deacetylase
VKNEQLINRLNDRIEQNRDDLIQKISDLIKVPSVVGKEGPAQDHMRSLYTELGLNVESFEADLDQIKDHPAFIPAPYDYNDRPNIIGVLPGDDRAPSIILNGHVDVVSPEPFDRWTHDPWGGEVEENRIFGRGACDMKAGLIANAMALKAITDCGIKPAGNVLLQSTIEEEAGGGGGALACFIKGYRASGMLVPEPSYLKLVTGHNGIKLFRVKVAGKSAHAAMSHTGVNAVGKMNKIYDALMDLDQKRASDHPFPLVEKYSGRSCNLSVGTYTAGDWPATVAGMAQMECRIGFVPGEKGDDIVKEIEQTITDVALSDEWLTEHRPTIEWFGWNSEAWLQDENDPFVQNFIASSAPLLGKTPELIAFPGGLDTRFSGDFGVPSFVFGPRGGNYHGPDEYVEIDSVVTLTKIIAKFVLDWCGVQE